MQKVRWLEDISGKPTDHGYFGQEETREERERGRERGREGISKRGERERVSGREEREGIGKREGTEKYR